MPVTVQTVDDLGPYIESDAVERGEDPSVEAEKRARAPDLYDCAVAIWELDRPDLVTELIARRTFAVDDPTPRSGQSLVYLAIVRSRVASFRHLVAAGADLTRQESEKGYAFWAVFTDADPAILEMLLARGVALDPTDLEVARRRAGPDVAALVARALAEGTAGLRRDVGAVRTSSSQPFAAGVRVKVVSGAFQGCRGSILAVLDGDVMTVKLSIFGRDAEMELAAHDLTAEG